MHNLAPLQNLLKARELFEKNYAYAMRGEDALLYEPGKADLSLEIKFLAERIARICQPDDSFRGRVAEKSRPSQIAC